MKDSNAQIQDPNAALESSMERRSVQETPLERKLFYDALASSLMILPIRQSRAADPRRWTPSNKEEDLTVDLTLGQNGEKTALAFTSKEALASWAPHGAGSTIVRGDDLIEICLVLDVEVLLINPAGPGKGSFLTRSEIRLLNETQNRHDRRQEEGSYETSIDVAAPQSIPEQLTEFLRANCRFQPEIHAAYLFEATFENGRPHLVLGVEPEGNEQQVEQWLKAMASPAAQILQLEQNLDFMLIDHEMAEKIGKIVPPLWLKP